MSLHADAVRVLEGWVAPGAAQETLRAGYLAHLAAHPDGIYKDGPAAHLTASCFVLDPTGTRTLLTHHAKGGFWVQFGGHCERGDLTLAGCAQREGREESGISTLTLTVTGGPVDLDRHRLPAAFGRCREHLDVAYLAVLPFDTLPAVSQESLDVAWFDLDARPQGTVADLPGRLRRVAGLVAARR